MKKAMKLLSAFIFAFLILAVPSVSAFSMALTSAAPNQETASVFVGEGLFCDYEKKLKVTSAIDYFFTDEEMSYASFEEKYLPCILEILDGEDADYHVFFSFGEVDTENPFAYPLGVGAEIAALINELKALYPETEFSFCDLSAEKEENAANVSELNRTVADYSLGTCLDGSVTSETGLSTLSEVRNSATAVLMSFEKLKKLSGRGDSGLLFADAVGYLFADGNYNSGFTGLSNCDGTSYYFVNGVFKPDYEGIAASGEEEYYVQNGVIDYSKNGSVSIGGATVTFENGKVVSRVSENRSYTPEELHAMKAVFLTFDDGPSPVTTSLLDTMDKYGVKATFFVTKQPMFVDILKDAANRGHAIAVHTSSHDYDSIYASYDAWKADFDDIYTWILENTGVSPTCYRFPGGSNTKRPTAEDKQKMKDYVHSLGMEYYDWNVVTGDGDYRVSAADEFTNATSDIDYRTVPVILAHDQDHNKSTAEALDSILAELTGRGYHFMTLRPGIPPVQQGDNWDY